MQLHDNAFEPMVPMATPICILKNDVVRRGRVTGERSSVSLNVFLAVLWRGQSPFMENTVLSLWETAVFPFCYRPQQYGRCTFNVLFLTRHLDTYYTTQKARENDEALMDPISLCYPKEYFVGCWW